MINNFCVWKGFERNVGESKDGDKDMKEIKEERGWRIKLRKKSFAVEF
jgi:hypothetical protein